VPFAAGAVYSTVEDMYLWDRAMFTESVLKKASWDKMFTPFLGSYGYGWRIDTIFNRKRIHHGGGHVGFQAHMARYVDDDACIIILTNMMPVALIEIDRDLAAILFGKSYGLPKVEK